MRRVGIVAVARRLAVALWVYHSTGEVPQGAKKKGAVVSPKPQTMPTPARLAA